MVHSAGEHGGGGERLANGPSPPARPTARVNFDLPPAKQPNQPVSPEKILPPSQAPNKFIAARVLAAPDFDLPPTEWPKLLVPPAQRGRANRSPSKFLWPKQDPVSAVHSAGGRGGGGDRLANGPSPHARPTARVNFDLPPAEWPHQPISPAKILPPSQTPNDFFAARATAAPKTAPPPSFPSHRARAVQEREAVEQADVHARTRNRAVQQELDPPNIVAAKLPPDKPNLWFAPKTIPQGELASLMQPQPLAEVHPFVPTLRKWQQGIPLIVAWIGIGV
jgi:hypothetical protein